MSKKKKTKKNFNNKPKKKSKKNIAVTITVLALAAIAIAAAIIVFKVFSSASTDELSGTSWISSSAKNASGDEVEMLEVYETNYTSYQGSLSFNDDKTFNFWLTPGDPEDGTHSGKYTLSDDYSKIDAEFDNGETTQFSITRDNNDISRISVDYNGYKVIFVRQ